MRREWREEEKSRNEVRKGTGKRGDRKDRRNKETKGEE